MKKAFCAVFGNNVQELGVTDDPDLWEDHDAYDRQINALANDGLVRLQTGSAVLLTLFSSPFKMA